MTLPIELHSTSEKKYSSKLDTFEACRRQFFFRYLLGWVPDYPAHDLYFGQAYHIAREHQLLFGYDDVQGAYQAFIEYYRKEFPPETDSIYIPKTPTGVLNALMTFAETKHRDLIDNEIVELDGTKMTEISGSVPVSESRTIYYRMDSIMRRKEDNMIFSWDHKTTSEKYINGRQWAENFHLSLQNGTYTHCLYCMFPIEQVLGIEFCGTGFTFLKRGSSARSAGYHATLRRVPAFKTPDQMNTWLWTVNSILDEIDYEMDRLSQCKEGDHVLMAFPMRSKSCTDFRGCPYHDYCLSWQNPLQQQYEPPIGFKQEFWDPSAMDTRVKKDLEWLGGN
jgi:hypothetical protein